MEEDCHHCYGPVVGTATDGGGGGGGGAGRREGVFRSATDEEEVWLQWEDQILMLQPEEDDGEDDEEEGRGAMLTDLPLLMIGEAEAFDLKNEVALWSRAEAQICAATEAEIVYKLEEEKDLKLATIAETEDVQRYLMMQSLMDGAKYLIDEKGAEEADYQDLICVHQAAKVLLQLIDQTMCRKMEDERLKVLNECSKALARQKEIEDVAAKERLQFNAEISKLKRDYRLLNEKLEWERDRSTCKICFTKARDVLILPCMHFQYCHACLNRHQKSRNVCPMCRSPISGVLKYNLSID